MHRINGTIIERDEHHTSNTIEANADTIVNINAGKGEAVNDQGAPLQHSTSDGFTDSAGSISRRDVLKVAAGAAIAAPLIGLEEAVAQQRRGRPGRSSKAAGAGSSKRPLFFSAAEFAMLDELTEMIIPTDDHSPGARAAGVALYLDRRIAETSPALTEYAKQRQTWRNGLKLVDGISQEMNGKSFMGSPPEQRLAVVTRMAEDEPRPQSPKPANPPQEGQQPTQPLQAPGQPGEIYKEGAQNRPEQKNPGSTRKSEGEFFTFLKTQTARAYYTSKIGIHQEIGYKGNQYLKEFVGYDMDGKFTDAPKDNSQSNPSTSSLG